MTAVTIVAAVKINQRKVVRRLERSGFAVTPDLVVSAPGRPDVGIGLVKAEELRTDSADAARELLGGPARAGLRCVFDGPAGQSDAWPAVVDIARAVAAEVPLAVLDDHAGTVYLIHGERGLVDPGEYEKLRGRPSTSDFMRRMLGGGEPR
jgi:hypothetical protein